MTHKTDEHDDNWGGARDGSGRKGLGELPSKQVGFKMSGEDLLRVEEVCQEGESINQAVRRLALERLEQLIASI